MIVYFQLQVSYRRLCRGELAAMTPLKLSTNVLLLWILYLVCLVVSYSAAFLDLSPSHMTLDFSSSSSVPLVLADMTSNRLTRSHDGSTGLWSFHGRANRSHADKTYFVYNADLLGEWKT